MKNSTIFVLRDTYLRVRYMFVRCSETAARFLTRIARKISNQRLIAVSSIAFVRLYETDETCNYSNELPPKPFLRRVDWSYTTNALISINRLYRYFVKWNHLRESVTFLSHTYTWCVFFFKYTNFPSQEEEKTVSLTVRYIATPWLIERQVRASPTPDGSAEKAAWYLTLL